MPLGLLLLLASQGGLIGPATGAEAAGAGGATLLAQATPESRQGPTAPQIPAEVERWFEEASKADDNGDAAEALRLQQQVMAWVQANLPRAHPYRAKALNNLGIYLSKLGRRQEALAPQGALLELQR